MSAPALRGPGAELGAPVAPIAPPALGSRVADFVDMLRPRVAGFVLFAAFVGGLLAAGPTAELWRVLEAAVFVLCTAGAASVFNQVIERDTDKLMERTRERPLPAGRLRVRDAVLFATALAAVGVAGLALRFDAQVALLALATLASYALVYTPLKRTSSFNTLVGAIPGAMPPLLGYAAIAGGTSAGAPAGWALGWGWMLFVVQFAWQFPHFMAIAWLHRVDYARAGMRMLPAIPGHEAMAGRQAVLHAAVLLVVSLAPGFWSVAGWIYTAAALLLGLAYLASSILFAVRPTRSTARGVVLVSLFYLPLLYSFVLLDPVVRLTIAS